MKKEEYLSFIIGIVGVAFSLLCAKEASHARIVIGRRDQFLGLSIEPIESNSIRITMLGKKKRKRKKEEQKRNGKRNGKRLTLIKMQ
jgi:hypothetical protein